MNFMVGTVEFTGFSCLKEHKSLAAFHFKRQSKGHLCNLLNGRLKQDGSKHPVYSHRCVQLQATNKAIGSNYISIEVL